MSLDENIEEYLNDFNEKFNKLNMLVSNYKNETIQTENTEELYDTYITKNLESVDTIRSHYGDILTNNRKTYYSTEAIHNLKTWYNRFWYVYYIIVIVIILGFILIENNNISLIKKILITILVLVYPYIIGPLVKFLYKLTNSLYKQLPKNVYNSI
jgi:hypothetical protein